MDNEHIFQNNYQNYFAKNTIFRKHHEQYQALKFL